MKTSKRLWQISSEWDLNSARAYADGLVVNDESSFLPDCGRFFAIGTLRQCLALASFQRRFFISQNGYNPIRVTREAGKVVYTVIAHFGAPVHELLRIEALDDQPRTTHIGAPRMADLHNVLCYKSYDDNAPILVIGTDRTILLNRHDPADSHIVTVNRDTLAFANGALEFQDVLYWSCSQEQTRAIVALAEAFMPVNVFLA